MFEDNNGKFAVDEGLLFTHSNGEHVWIIGTIETSTKELRLDIQHSRNASNIEIFIKKFIPPHNTVIIDGCQG